MTMINYSLLLLLSVLTTIALATQPVKGDAQPVEEDASVGHSNPRGCISDWRGLNKAYLDHQSSADVENSIFNFYPSDAINYGVLVMFYDVGPPPKNTTTSGRRECCQRGSKDCIIHFIYRFKIFRDIHPPLLYSRAGHRFYDHNEINSLSAVFQLCWSLPPLCNNRQNNLWEFSEQFVGLVLEENTIDSQVSPCWHDFCKPIRNGIQYSLTAIPILLIVTVGLLLVLYMHHNWGQVGTVLADSQVARHTMRSTMLASWILLPLMMVHFYAVTREMAGTIEEKTPLKLFQDVYTPQVTAGYVQWGSFLTILLLEVPFLYVFFLRKSTALHKRKQRLSKTGCHLCYWVIVLCDTLGGIGMVAAVQFASVYLFYNALQFMVSPIFTIASVSLSATYIVVGIACTTMLQQMVSSCCETCSFIRIIKGLAFLLLSLVCLAINYYVVKQLRGDKHNYHNSIHDLLISLVSSVIIGVYGYSVKKLLFQKKEAVSGAEREDNKSAPLIPKEENIP